MPKNKTTAENKLKKFFPTLSDSQRNAFHKDIMNYIATQRGEPKINQLQQKTEKMLPVDIHFSSEKAKHKTCKNLASFYKNQADANRNFDKPLGMYVALYTICSFIISIIELYCENNTPCYQLETDIWHFGVLLFLFIASQCFRYQKRLVAFYEICNDCAAPTLISCLFFYLPYTYFFPAITVQQIIIIKFFFTLLYIICLTAKILRYSKAYSQFPKR